MLFPFLNNCFIILQIEQVGQSTTNPQRSNTKWSKNGEADRANEQKEQLLDRIQAYHRHIYKCTAERKKAEVCAEREYAARQRVC